MNKEARTIEQVISKIVNHRKANIKGLIRLIIDNSENPEDNIPVEVIHECIDITFLDVLSPKEKIILKDALDTDTNRLMKTQDFLNRLKTNIKDEGDRIQIHFFFRAFILDKIRKSTEDYFYDYRIFRGREYTQQDFIGPAIDSLGLAREEAIYAFQVLADRAECVLADDVFECVQCFRFTNPYSTCGPPQTVYPPTKPSKNTPATDEYIKRGDSEKLDQNKQNQKPVQPSNSGEAITTVKNELKKKKLSALHVYRVADTSDIGNVSVITLRNAFQELLPELKPQTIFSLMKIIDTNRNGFIEMSEYEIVMLDDKEDLKAMKDNDSRVENNLSEMNESMKGSAMGKSARGSIAGSVVMSELGGDEGKGRIVDSDDPADIARQIGDYFSSNNMKPDAVFRYCDETETGTVPVLTILQNFKESMPDADHKLLAKGARALDSLRTGFISKGDFIAGLSSKNKPPKPQKLDQTPKPIQANQKKETAKQSTATQISEPPLDDGSFYSQVRILRYQLIAKNVEIETLFEEKEMSVIGLANELQRLLPDFPKSKLIGILKYLDSAESGLVRKEEFELMIGVNKETSEIQESRLFDEVNINRTAIEAIRKIIERKKVKLSEVFRVCDTDSNGYANILDIKKGLEYMMQGEDNIQNKIIAFVKELKSVYKTNNFNSAKFELFMKSPEKAYIHESRIINLSRIRSIQDKNAIDTEIKF